VSQISSTFEKQKDLVKAVKGMAEDNSKMAKQVERFQKNMLGVIARNLEQKLERFGDISLSVSKVEVDNPTHLRDLAFQIRSRYPNVSLILGAEIDGKAHLAIMLGKLALESYDLNASQLIREVSGEIQGGGGGQPFFATAGGKNPAGIDAALAKARKIIVEAVE